MKRLGLLFVGLLMLAAVGFLVAQSCLGEATIEEETPFIIPAGSSLSAAAEKLEEEGLISSAEGFLLRARIFGSSKPIQAGEFALRPDMDQGDILAAFQSGDVIRRFITIPEGMPSILVMEKLMAEDLLTGEIDVPLEGSILPDTYAYKRGQNRSEIIEQMQAAMDKYLAEAWAERGPDIAVETMREALILASIVEKETGIASERARVAAVFINRLRKGMRLQSDPTVIYAVTRGETTLDRPISRADLNLESPYNTYRTNGLPPGPIANPGLASIEAVLNPADTNDLYFVADGTGGHAFSRTLKEHNRNVRRWRELRRQND